MMSRIPRILHYCFGLTPDFGGKPWSLVHYVAVASAIRHIRPEAVYLYYEHEPLGRWWELTKAMVTPIKIAAPTEIFGRPLLHPAHKADVVRLEKLIESGGIYLDADVLIHREFDALLGNSTVLGREGFGSVSGIANALILAEPHAPFLKRWYKEYDWFRSKGRDEYWNEHSVKLPERLANEYPDEVTVLPPTSFYWPLWTDPHVEWIFNSSEAIPIDDAYASHLWESNSWKYLHHLTPGEVRKRDTNFHRWARPYVEQLPDDLGHAPLEFRLKKRAKLIVRACKQKVRAAVGLAQLGQKDASQSKFKAGVGRRETFENIYQSGLWGSENGSKFFSGVGSRGLPAIDYIRNMTAILKWHEDTLGREITVVDVGCGDFAVGSALTKALPTLRYIGCDIVAPLIEHLTRSFGCDRISFQELDLVVDRPPQGDICLIRQVFQHLSNADIAQGLNNLSGFVALYVTEGQPEVRSGSANPDKIVGADVRFDWRRGVGRGVEIGMSPFNRSAKEVFRTYAFPHEVIVTERVEL